MPLFLLIVFAFFCHCNAASGITVGIFTYKVFGMSPWDPDSVKRGITGSEEAVIYVSEELAKLGCHVIVYGDPPNDSKYNSEDANPKYVSLDSQEDINLDVAISWRVPDAALRLKKRARCVYLWPHDTYHWVLDERLITAFDGVLWLSQWQREQWISVNSAFKKFTHIFGNGIIPSQFDEIQERGNPHSCIYASNYARGLEVLLDIWPEVKKHFPKATLDIYYGWNHWGLLPPDKEAHMRKQIVSLEVFGVHEHGLVGHDELNRAYANSSLWTYPCIAPEVFCISALRAQYSGAVPVIIKGSALAETVPHGYMCQEREKFQETLLIAMRQAEQHSVDDRKTMRNFIDEQFTWEAIAQKWKLLFERDLQRNLDSSLQAL